MQPESPRRVPPGTPTHRPVAGVVIPIRAFSVGKIRLADALGAEHRAGLARQMARRVVDAAGTLPTVVVSGAPEVQAWARELGLATLDDPGTLDGAAALGVRWCGSLGLPRAVVAHADLPHATSASLEALGADAGRPIAGLVPCHRDDGTPVLAIPVATVLGDARLAPRFRFAYGAGSFRRHLAAARAAGLAVRVVRDPGLRFDVDVPADLAALTTADP